ncbi:tetratricopeptide repeat protein [Streptomyces sp. CRN 30]|uniref:tetratricopeptide repeat protein n=1 Tax=Streptomyces sp. CRN 30 TaxID=3075613 RepID=UPI002A81F055|nr:tetratricopeptide repeat protein [Streptomyces sp. CRN 30]
MGLDDVLVKAVHTAAQGVFLALTVLLALGAVRGVSSLSHRMRARGRILPLILVPSNSGSPPPEGPGEEAVRPSSELTAHLAAHLTEHGGESILAPGGASTAGADSRPQASDPTQGWIGSVLRVAIAGPPGYAVHLEALGDHGARHRVSVTIVRVPHNRIIAAAVIADEDEERLLEKIAVHCIWKVRNQPAMLRRIPRWERWGQDEQAVAHYRRGMYEQRAQNQAGGQHAVGEYDEALRAFEQAARFAPGNLLVRHSEAALIELKYADHPAEYQRAITIYQGCTKLWSEHIETAYRMAIAYSRAARPLLRDRNLPSEDAARLRDMPALAREHLDDICERLRLPSLLRRWLRSIIPGGRYNSGERRYWGSWLLPLPLPARRSQRRTFLGAIHIALAAHDLTEIQHNGHDRETTEEQCAKVRDAFDRVAREVLVRKRRPRRGSGVRRLLHDDHTLGRSAHGMEQHRDVMRRARATSRHWGPERKASTGWMTHYNAACFLALAVKLPDWSLPRDYTTEQWREDCTRSALNQLDRSTRTHDSTLTGDWIAHDPDLRNLWTSEAGAKWAAFMNVRPAVVRGRSEPP